VKERHHRGVTINRHRYRPIENENMYFILFFRRCTNFFCVLDPIVLYTKNG